MEPHIREDGAARPTRFRDAFTVNGIRFGRRDL